MHHFNVWVHVVLSGDAMLTLRRLADQLNLIHRPTSLPSRAPQLNPVQNVRQRWPANWLSNRVLEPLDDIIDAICDARSELKPNPERHVNRNTRIGQRRSHHDSWQSDCFHAV